MFKKDHDTTVRGAGLARGPALFVGLTLAVFGLILFFRVSGAPLSTAGFPDATVSGERLLGFEANAWTAWLTIAAGVLLLVAASQHLVAKAMSLIVGLALGAASVIALVDGSDVLGLAATNGLTALGWGIAAALLLANTLLPRLRRTQTTSRETDARPTADQRADARPTRAPAPTLHEQDRTPADDRRPTVVPGGTQTTDAPRQSPTR
ncbi:MAG: hypothetical protein JHD16_14750 [Solirubrobacteraceae bacterium]|nr:hypothetical protein [Solirubrobacteraceae bacterium]